MAAKDIIWWLVISLQTVTGSIDNDIMRTQTTGVGFLNGIVRTHYRNPETFVAIRVQNGIGSVANRFQQDLIDDIVRTNHDWMIVTFVDLPLDEWRPAYYNVFLVHDHSSLRILAAGMSHETHHHYGLYTIFVEQLDVTHLYAILELLWDLTIMNVVVIFKETDGTYVAYGYQPYGEGKCGTSDPYEAGRYVDGAWTNLDRWFPPRTTNFNGCPLMAGTVDIRPCSMHDREGNRTVHTGIEVSLAKNLAEKLNFTIIYRIPEGPVKWGMMRAVNSTGLVGLIQRKEVHFGFGSMGIGAARVQYLRTGTPSRYGQLLMAIPPKRPYTSFEKLFQPFTLPAWLCIILCYGLISLIALTVFGLRKFPGDEPLPNAFYTIWVLLMGGPCQLLRMDSSRLFVVSFMLNTLVVRTLYHAAMFEKLQASNSLASDLNSLSEINRAGMMYYMHRSITLYFNDNPLVGPGRILIIKSDKSDWEELLYAVSQHEGNFVVALPLDCIKYYVKMNGKRGLVYVGRDTGFTYNTAFYYPKTTPLQESFSSVTLFFHSAGLVNYWAQEFEDSRFWSNAKTDPEPASLKWNHMSGAFYLCGAMLAMAVGVFFVELGHHRWCKKVHLNGGK